jgi:hypothetical protein
VDLSDWHPLSDLPAAFEAFRPVLSRHYRRATLLLFRGGLEMKPGEPTVDIGWKHIGAITVFAQAFPQLEFEVEAIQLSATSRANYFRGLGVHVRASDGT